MRSVVREYYELGRGHFYFSQEPRVRQLSNPTHNEKINNQTPNPLESNPTSRTPPNGWASGRASARSSVTPSSAACTGRSSPTRRRPSSCPARTPRGGWRRCGLRRTPGLGTTRWRRGRGWCVCVFCVLHNPRECPVSCLLSVFHKASLLILKR